MNGKELLKALAVLSEERGISGFPCHFPLKEEMATHSSILAWKIP